MAIPVVTHFKFVYLPLAQVIQATVDGVDIVLDQLYPIAQESLVSFVRLAPYDENYISTYASYKVYDSVNDIYSNQAQLNLEWIETTGTPSSTDQDILIVNNDTFDLLSQLPLDPSTQFIQILSIEGVENLLYKGNPTYEGLRLSTEQLAETVYTAEAIGGGDPYFTLNYYVGANNNVEPTVYSMVLRINSLAELAITAGPTVVDGSDDFDDPTPTTYATKTETTILEITKGYAYGTAEVTITIDSDFLDLNAWNSVILNYNGVEREEFVDIVITENVDLDKFGRAVISVANFIVYDTADPANGDITITVNDINGDPLLVNGTQSENLLLSL
jgi:hypothetical protein